MISTLTNKNLTPTDAAAETAAQLVHATVEATDERTIKIIKEYFDEGEERKRFIDVNRIPFICQDIKSIKDDLKILNRYIFIGIGGLIILSILIPIIVQFILK